MAFHYTNYVVETNIWWLRRIRPVKNYLFQDLDDSFDCLGFLGGIPLLYVVKNISPLESLYPRRNKVRKGVTK